MKIDEIELEVIKDYFKGLKRYRGIYYVTLRVLVARELRLKGMTLKEIAETLFSNRDRHDTIHHYLKNYNIDKDILGRLGGWRDWIIRNEYPITNQYWESYPAVISGEVKQLKFSKCDIIPLTSKEANRFSKLNSYQRNLIFRKKNKKEERNKLKKPLAI